jgi:beta-glucosidase/6-phospho-beta-glucosidase/beta-galactosidase
MKSFKTFFIGGYECADMINNRRSRVDLLQMTGHDRQAGEDYRLLTEAGIHTVREGIRWSVVEREPYRYDFSEVKARILAAQINGIQQLWDICHFGYPDDLSPLHPEFCNRFVALCRAFAEVYRLCTDDPLIVTPINEISFLSWLSGDVAGTVPFLHHSAAAVKYNLCRAAIKGIETIKVIDPAAKIMMVEPLIRIHPQEGHSITNEIQQYNEGQFEAMDIVTGRLHPELGGRTDYMDFAGFNYYYHNQWEHEGRHLCWTSETERSDFPGLLKAAAERYGKPVVLSETGHFKEDRGLWMEQITKDCMTAMNAGVNLQGICIYPVLDRPDWDSLAYINCGIWGYHEKTKERFVEQEYLGIVKSCVAEMNQYLDQYRETLVQKQDSVLAA